MAPTSAPTLPTLSPALLHIDGRTREGRGAAITTRCPATAEPLVTFPAASGEDLDAAIAAARRTFDEGTWRDAAPERRAAVLSGAADRLAARHEELVRLIVADNGKTLGEAAIDVLSAVGVLRAAAQHAGRPTVTEMGEERGVRKQIRREPIGVVAGITPFNAPIAFTALKAAPALAAGNSIVLKPSERAPLAPLAVCEALAAAGAPAGVVNLVQGDTATAAALAGDPRVDLVSLTGGTPAGEAVMRAAAPAIKRVVLELGGKSAHILLEDADLEAAIPAVAGGIFKNAGQRCLSGSRLLVDASIADEVEARIAAFADRLIVGDPLDPATQVGAMIDGRAVEDVAAFVARARGDGLAVAAGGHRVAELAPGSFFRPTVMTGANRGSRAAQDEIFGPVLTVIRVNGPEEAVAVANDSRYGLAAGIWSRDVDRAAAMARRIRAGYVWVNTYAAIFGDMPFGGFKRSGLGREGGVVGYEAYTELKSVLADTTGGTTALRF